MASSSLSLEGSSHGNKNAKWVPFDIGIMIVDEDPTSLLFVHTLLMTCHYRVVAYENPIEALYELVKRRGEFDLVITDLHMVAMPGFNLVEYITKGFKLPVITTCADEDPEILHQALNSGACFHLVKPMTINNMEFVWKKSWKLTTKQPPIDQPQRALNVPYEGDCSNVSIVKWFFPTVTSFSITADVEPTTVRNKNHRLGEKEEDPDTKERKSRLQWDCELHKRFLVAVALLGDDAVPSAIIGIMNVSGMTTKQVASHLQKHRKRLIKEKQMQEKEKNLPKALVISQKFPTSLTPSCSKKPVPTLPDIHINQEQLLTDGYQKSSGKKTPCILPEPPTTNHLQIQNGPLLLNQHNSNFWKPLLGPSKTKPRSKVESKRKGKLMNQQNPRRDVTKFTLPESSTTNTNYESNEQFMNFATNIAGPSENHNVDDFIQISSPLPYMLDSTAESNSLQGIFEPDPEPEPMNINPMQELVNNNDWPTFDEFVGLNDEPFVLQNGLDAGMLGSSKDFTYDSEYNNYRNTGFDDDAFLDEILNNIDKGRPA